MFGNHRQAKDKLQHEVPVARNIDAVGRDRVEFELAGDHFAVDRQAGAGHRRGPQAEHIGRATTRQATAIAL